MIKVKKNKFIIDDEEIIIKLGIGVRILAVLLFSVFSIFPFFIFYESSIDVLEGIIAFKIYFLFLIFSFLISWYLAELKIIFNNKSKTITKKRGFIKKEIIDFNSIESIRRASYDYIDCYEIVLKKDPLGKHKIISPKYSKTIFDQKQLEEFDQKILPNIQRFINQNKKQNNTRKHIEYFKTNGKGFIYFSETSKVLSILSAVLIICGCVFNFTYSNEYLGEYAVIYRVMAVLVPLIWFYNESLKIEIKKETVTKIYFFGIFKKSFPLKTFQGFSVVRNSTYFIYEETDLFMVFKTNGKLVDVKITSKRNTVKLNDLKLEISSLIK